MNGQMHRAPHQKLALGIGVTYLVVGVAGFFVTGFSGFTEHNHEQTLFFFAVNPLHNVVHLLIGVLGVALWRTPQTARTYGWLLAVGYGLTTVYGLVVVNNPQANLLNINGADNVLHILSTVAGLAIALWPARDRALAASGTR